MLRQYPAQFRLPENVEYSESVDMGILASSIEVGFTHQRRRYRTMPTVATLTFIMTDRMRGRFQQWWNLYGCDYFEMTAPTMVASLNGTRCKTIAMRGISDLEITTEGSEHWKIRARVEFHPAWSGAS